MPRGPRIHFPGAVLHVYGRGIEKRQIYLDDQDRHVFLDRFVANLDRWHVRCMAWALMPNHFHLLLKCETGELPSLMQCLLTGYSNYFNERHKRVGHLFQNRYKSRIITKESYLREVTRYIHLNPIRAGLVGSLEELEKYPWSGHLHVLSARAAGWMDFGLIRELFPGQAGTDWKIRYLDYVEEGLRMGGIEDASKTETGSLFDDQMDSSADSSGGDKRPQEKFFKILARVSAKTGISCDEIVGRDRKFAAVRARRDVLRACRSEMGVSIAEASRWLGITEDCGGYLSRTKNPEKGSS